MSDGLNWNEIRQKYDDIRKEFRMIKFYGEAERKQQLWHMQTGGLVPSPDWNAVYDGRAVYLRPITDKIIVLMDKFLRKEEDFVPGEDEFLPVNPEDNGIICMAIDLARQFDIPLSRSFEKLDQKRRDIRSHEINLQAIEDAIEHKCVTQEFLWAWGELHAAQRDLNVIIQSLEANHEFHERGLIGALQNSTEVQQYWYAHWMLKNAKPFLKEIARIDAQAELGRLCYDIAKGKIAPTTPYPQRWFAVLLEGVGKQKRLTRRLRDSFIKLKPEEIQEMACHPILTENVLPPTDLNSFMKIS